MYAVTKNRDTLADILAHEKDADEISAYKGFYFAKISAENPHKALAVLTNSAEEVKEYADGLAE